jgi:hypothetical protein
MRRTTQRCAEGRVGGLGCADEVLGVCKGKGELRIGDQNTADGKLDGDVGVLPGPRKCAHQTHPDKGITKV